MRAGDASATLHVVGAEEFLAKLEAEERALTDAWVADAKRAWDAGQSFYQPVIIEFIRLNDRRWDNDKPQSAEMTARALDAIVSVGWTLQTWSASATVDMAATRVVAHPLFVRA